MFLAILNSNSRTYLERRFSDSRRIFPDRIWKFYTGFSGHLCPLGTRMVQRPDQTQLYEMITKIYWLLMYIQVSGDNNSFRQIIYSVIKSLGFCVIFD